MGLRGRRKITTTHPSEDSIEQHVELDRRFRDLTDEEREDPAILAFLGDRDMPRGTDWPELLESERVVLFAEAGSGKTREMQAQAKRLTAEGKAAFFIPIEALDKEDVRGILAMEPHVVTVLRDVC